MVPITVCGLLLLTHIAPSLESWGDEFQERYGALVHLMEWPYEAIKQECNYLKHKGYFGIVISPPIEHVVDGSGPSWEERYKPISTTKMFTRSGTKKELENMIKKCWGWNNIRIIVDLNLNNMLKSTDAIAAGMANSQAKPSIYEYPDDINKKHFHDSCQLTENDLYSDRHKVRVCEVDGMQDLDNNNEELRKKHQDMMNELIKLGVSGFRIVLARHMHPDDLNKLYLGLNKMRNGQTPIKIHDINDMDRCIVKAKEYENVGMTTDYEYGDFVARYFLKESQDLHHLLTWDNIEVNVRNSDKDRLVFLYNHLTPATLREKLLNPKNKKAYRMAMAFMMAFPYGVPMVLSSYNGKVAPLDDRNFVKSPRPSTAPADKFQYDCISGYNCEHHDDIINKMVIFKADVKEKKLSMLKSLDKDRWFAFEREDCGFIFFNAGQKDIQQRFTKLKMKPGEYCDVASGELVDVGSKCSGKIITIDDRGRTTITIDANDPNGYVAIHKTSWLDPVKKGIGSVVGTNPHVQYMFGLGGKLLSSLGTSIGGAVGRVQETSKNPQATTRDVLAAGLGETGVNLLEAAGTVAVATAKGAGDMAKNKLREAAARRES